MTVFRQQERVLAGAVGNPRYLSEQLPNIIGQSGIVDVKHARSPNINFTLYFLFLITKIVKFVLTRR